MLEAGPGLRRRRPHSPHPLTQLCLVVLHRLIVWTTRKAAEEKGGRLTSLGSLSPPRTSPAGTAGSLPASEKLKCCSRAKCWG